VHFPAYEVFAEDNFQTATLNRSAVFPRVKLRSNEEFELSTFRSVGV